MRVFSRAIILSFGFHVACVTDSPLSNEKLDQQDMESLAPMLANESEKFSSLKKLGANKLEWMRCQSKSENPYVLLFHGEHSQFNAKNFCRGWVSQAFLQFGWNVLAINRVGFGQSKGKRSTFDLSQIKEIRDLATFVVNSISPPSKIKGVFGKGTGATWASLYARAHQGLEWAILGNGLYDLHAALENSKSAEFLRFLDSQKKRWGDEGFDRLSIAYDVEGMPSKVFLFHGQKNLKIKKGQSLMFRDILDSRQIRVTLRLVESDETIDGKVQQHLIRQALESFQNAG